MARFQKNGGGSSGPVNTDEVTNASSVPGDTCSEALDNLSNAQFDEYTHKTFRFFIQDGILVNVPICDVIPDVAPAGDYEIICQFTNIISGTGGGSTFSLVSNNGGDAVATGGLDKAPSDYGLTSSSGVVTVTKDDTTYPVYLNSFENNPPFPGTDATILAQFSYRRIS